RHRLTEVRKRKLDGGFVIGDGCFASGEEVAADIPGVECGLLARCGDPPIGEAGGGAEDFDARWEVGFGHCGSTGPTAFGAPKRSRQHVRTPQRDKWRSPLASPKNL